tara:strand:+ start:1956 stop:3023 length:1068 start_codon:yes stop_codon:yes gene_type:complete
MESIGGMGSAINQANSIGDEDVSVMQGISMLNNKNLVDYKEAMKNEEDRDTHTDEQNLQKVGAYGLGIGEKVNEAKEFVKGGGDLYANFGSVGANSVIGKIGRGLTSTAQGVQKTGNTVISGVQSIGSRNFKPGELSGSDEIASIEAGRPSEKPGTGTTTATTEDLATQPIEDHVAQPEKPVVEPPEGSVVEGTESGSTKTVQTSLEGGLEEGAGIGSKLGSFAGGVAKVGGGLFSAGMLGDDVYNQVKDKKFFYGDNTGDKVGNFMNEMGSVADLGGIATGDPLLVLAGVGLGAVGSVVSDVSELFGHHKKEADDAKTEKPVQIQESASQNIAGQGEVASTGLSSLRLVQSGQA